MKIIPLDFEKKHILQCFLEIIYKYPGTSSLYKRLYQRVKSKGIVKDSNRNILRKISRIFLDIYKRICIKLIKKNPETVHLSRQMQEKVYLVIRYYEQLDSKDIFIRLCQRYFGNKQLGKVTEQEEIQFYEEVNLKVKQKFQKIDLVDYQEKENDDSDKEKEHKAIHGKFVLFAKGKAENQIDQTGYYEMNIEKKWKKKLQSDLKKLEGEEKIPKNNLQKQQNLTQTQIQEKPQNQLVQKQLTIQQHSNGHTLSQQDKIKVSVKNQQALSTNKKVQEIKLENIEDRQKIQRKNLSKQRKVKKVKGPKPNNPPQMQQKVQIWTEQLRIGLCKKYLEHPNNLTSFVSEFLKSQKSHVILTDEEISQQLIKIMLQSYDFYLNSHNSEQKSLNKFSELQIYGRQEIQSLLKMSACNQLRKKLISIYVEMKKQNFKIKEKQAHEIFLYVKQQITKMKIKKSQQKFETQLFGSLISAQQRKNQKPLEQTKEMTIKRRQRVRELMNTPLKQKSGKWSLAKSDEEELLRLKNGKKPRKMKKPNEIL